MNPVKPPISNDARVLSYILTLAQSQADPLLRAHDFDLIEKAKLLAQRDLMQAKIDSMTAVPTLKAVDESELPSGRQLTDAMRQGSADAR